MSEFSTADHQFMSMAIALAEKGLYSTDPNPRVGCVLVKGDNIVGQGWHEVAGGPHAEINALKAAGEQARGATAYVTLEPCSHHGKTPPCAEALIQAGVSRVVAAMKDPNPLVAGKGLKLLSDAGIQVESGLMQAQAEALNPGFIMRMKKARPFVRCKLAMGLDGRTAMASGESKWITGEAARADVQRLRARSSAIVTGIGTVLADDPSMNVRAWPEGFPADQLDKDQHQPLRVVLDPHLSMPRDARMLSLPGETLIVTACEPCTAWEIMEDAGAKVISLPKGPDAIDLKALLRKLGSLEVNEILLETGATLSGAMLSAGLIDELVVYMAPLIMGSQARGLFNLPGLEQMEQRIDLNISDVRAVGRDWRFTANVVPRAAEGA